MELVKYPDWRKRVARHEKFLRHELDGALAIVSAPSKKTLPVPVAHHKTLADQWVDTDFICECTAVNIDNIHYLGDALPIAFPNLGPDFLSSLQGCKLNFGESTSWSEPCLIDWKYADKIHLDLETFSFKKMVEITDALIERSRGGYIVGLTDFHPGGDNIAALRDPVNLCADLIEHPDEVKKLLLRTEPWYFQVYDFFYEKTKSAGHPCTSWTPFVVFGKYYIPSNDFSCMVSKEMFDEFFLEGIRRECRYLDYSIYHLDGPNARRHLDSLLGIKELDAIQWVPGAGQDQCKKWMDLYRKIQSAGKAVQLGPENTGDLEVIFRELKPELSAIIMQAPSLEAGQDIVRRIQKWK